MSTEAIVVKSHVSRDLLQNAALDLPARTTEEAELGTSGQGGAQGGGDPRSVAPGMQATPEGTPQASPSERKARRLRRGGFDVAFKAMGIDEHRAVYVADERTIYINTDHPQVTSARGSAPTDDPTFRRLAFEVAFTEYAIAITSELGNRGEYSDWSDPIFDVRETINRLARKSAHLYRDATN